MAWQDQMLITPVPNDYGRNSAASYREAGGNKEEIYADTDEAMELSDYEIRQRSIHNADKEQSTEAL
jgi:hypothetical protein